jgi:hypothetical protein
MSLKDFEIGDMRTIAQVRTNAQKTVYGYGQVGAGFKDQYTDLMQVRGKFTQFTGRRTTASGDVLYVQMFKFITRFATQLNNEVPNQLSFLIGSKVYTVDSFTLDEQNKEMFMIFKLNQFSK